MCGISGILQLDGAPADAAHAGRMVQAIAHRGPDDHGSEARGPAALAHVRLSIVDLLGGHQPMTKDHALIAFNGEIFNHVELRAELIGLGRRFRTSSDTEVLLASYLEWGDRCVERLNGQWAFALWDDREQRLLLSRDRMGIRPLYYARAAGRLLFASEIKALLTDPAVPRRLDPRGIDQALTFWHTVAPRTIFEGVQELPPGCSLAITPAGRELLTEHFRLDYSAEPCGGGSAEHAERLLEALEAATRLRLLRSDVPVGAYVSGGLDSAVIAALARRVSSAPLRTYSVAFEDAELDETAFQRQVVGPLGLNHTRLVCTKDDICQSFPDVVWHAETPLLRTAPAPLFALARAARADGTKVVLTGEGSDELLGGYDIFKEARVRRFCAERPSSTTRPLLLRRLYHYLPGIHAQSDESLRAFFRARPEDLSNPLFSHLPRWEVTSGIKRFLSEDVTSSLRGISSMDELRERLPSGIASWSPFHQAQYLEARTLLPGYILSSQGDRVAMAHGVEGRFPFLDPTIVELSLRMPPSVKMRGLDEKRVLKDAARDLVAPAVLARPKQPFRAPAGESFFDVSTGRARRAWVDELLSPSSIAATGVFAPKAVTALADKARRGRIVGMRDGMALVAILSTELLSRQLLQQQRVT